MKTVVKGLINRSIVKLEYVQAIAEALENDQINEGCWEDIFNGQGAEDTLKQGIYSPQMVRLLALRAIAIPQTLPEYLVWLGNGSKGSDNNTLSVEFQSHIKNSLIQIPHVGGNIEFNVVEGIRLLLPKLLEQKVTVESVAWLLSSANGLWASKTCQVVQEIDRDLQSMNQSAKSSGNVDFKLTDKSWQNIRCDLKKDWQIRHCAPQEKYQAFAELFDQLHQYKLSIFFYHVYLDKVPKKVFVKLYPNGWHCLVYGISIEREVTIPEVLLLTILKVGSIEVRVPFVILITVLSLGLGLAGGLGLAAVNKQQAANPQASSTSSDSQSPPITMDENQHCDTKLPDIGKDKTLPDVKNFYAQGKTYEAIRRIICETSKLDNKKNMPQVEKEKKVIDALNSVLIKPLSPNISQVNTDLSINQKDIKYLTQQIINYQTEKNLNQKDGVINLNKETYTRLKCDIAKKIKPKLNEDKTFCPVNLAE